MGFISKYIDKRLASFQRNLIDIHYAEVENMYRDMRGWKHDYKNHLQAIRALAESGDIETLLKYIDDLSEDIKSLDRIVKTGNTMADAILNSKISLARSKGINVIVDAHIPVKLSMSEMDLCVILGNLFDNAIDANLSLDEADRLIRVYMTMKGSQLYISFTNLSSSPKLNKVNGKFKSTKGKDRGFGLIRIDSIVERLDGFINRNSEDGAFTTEILIPQV